jgi:hypothetical protein
MRILVVNVNTSVSMTDSIGEAARHYASSGTTIEAIQPYDSPALSSSDRGPFTLGWPAGALRIGPSERHEHAGC